MMPLFFTILAAVAALGYAMYNFKSVKALDEGTEKMVEIAAAIREGANAFINYEYRIITIIVGIVAILFSVIFSLQEGAFRWEPSVCFVIGTVFSACAGYIGMKIATYANVRV